MENLNAEQVMKALECCTRGRKSKDDRPCDDCPYNECNLVGGTSERQTTGTCQGWLMKDALALINSQEQRNRELTEENDVRKRCNIMLNNELRRIDNIKADTVRKMQTEIKKTLSAICKGEMGDLYRIIDQIAKEMLEVAEFGEAARECKKTVDKRFSSSVTDSEGENNENNN